MLLQLLCVFFLQFTDKMGSDKLALSETALEMRKQNNIAIDSLDYAVSPIYIDSIRSLGAKVLHTSRWMNGATVQATMEVKDALEACDFIDTVYLTRDSRSQLQSVNKKRMSVVENRVVDNDMNYGMAQQQIEQLNLHHLHEMGFHGQGIRLGICDILFAGVDSLSAFASVRDQYMGMAKIHDEEYGVFDTGVNNHGAECLSVIVAEQDDFRGSATGVDYFLFMTEELNTESPKEADNMVVAMEMADSIGLHILSVSLVYRQFDNPLLNFTYADLDGNTIRASKAALIAARKGLLLVVCAGNDGSAEWHYIAPPADADSILAVGAVDQHGEMAFFSSYGPTADGRVKPDVCARGYSTYFIDPDTDKWKTGHGTSYACPLIAGMAACLWSAMPEATNMEIRERIIQSANRYNNPGEHYGHGIPDALSAYQMSLTNIPSVKEEYVPARKMLYNGRIYIQRNNTYYDLLGNKWFQR